MASHTYSRCCFPRPLIFTFLALLLLLFGMVSITAAVPPIHGLIANSNSAEAGHSAEAETLPKSAPELPTDDNSGYNISDLQVMLEGFINVLYWRLDILITANAAKAPYDVAQAMNHISRGRGTMGFFRMLGTLGIVFALSFVVEFLFRRFISRFRVMVPEGTTLPLTRRLWMLLLDLITKLILLAVFVAVSYLFYVLLYTDYFSGLCPLYLSLLTTILIARTVAILSEALFSPHSETIRLFPLNSRISRIEHRSLVLFSWVLVSGIFCSALLEHAGLEGDSKLIVRLLFGSLNLFTVAILLLIYRQTISQWIQGDAGTGMGNWFRNQMVSKWLFMSFGYIFMLWVVWVIQLVIVGPEFGFAYGVSLFVVPIFLISDSILGWLLTSINGPETAQTEDPDEPRTVQKKEHIVYSYFRAFTRVVLAFGIGLWVLSLWGKGMLFSDESKTKGLEIFFILLVTYLLWLMLNIVVSSYLDNRAKKQAEEEEDVDSEWGDSPLLDRSQTLLPLVRKFSGVIMLVMMILLILSALGINIGPLLAGAGVIGIAIGFGAQKLVSDILSGFFYLLDDAFRVGEYIKTASISGAVEKITLRNVMLRHHRGMLQIVPYSDLGAITNYMRGGIVVKFNLQFPYDTDVDQVRKVIKKVGIAMLDDPEFGKNFIKQVKSQGIREVADSVLTIRVKFTAQPGTHFLIRREAYRRIAEALADKGIFYAHRKVIVEVPADSDNTTATMADTRKKRLAEAGAAAQLKTETEKQPENG